MSFAACWSGRARTGRAFCFQESWKCTAMNARHSCSVSAVAREWQKCLHPKEQNKARSPTGASFDELHRRPRPTHTPSKATAPSPAQDALRPNCKSQKKDRNTLQRKGVTRNFIKRFLKLTRATCVAASVPTPFIARCTSRLQSRDTR